MSLKCTGKSYKCLTHWTNNLKTPKPQFIAIELHSRRNSILHLVMEATKRENMGKTSSYYKKKQIIFIT